MIIIIIKPNLPREMQSQNFIIKIRSPEPCTVNEHTFKSFNREASIKQTHSAACSPAYLAFASELFFSRCETSPKKEAKKKSVCVKRKEEKSEKYIYSVNKFKS